MTGFRPRHDQLTKKAFENPMVRREFFEEHAPPQLKQILDMDSLKLEKDSFVEKNLNKSLVDLLFSAKFNNEDGFIYLLLEQQSKPDYWMSFRLFKYMMNILEKYRADHPESKKLPLIYPIILHSGTKKYTAPRNLWDLFEKPELAREFWTNDYQLINVHDIPDEELKSHLWSGTLQFFLKAVHERDMLKAWHQIADLLPQMVKGEVQIGYDYIEILLHYSLTVMQENDKIELEKVITKSLYSEGKKIMATIAQALQHEGIQIGKTEGIQIGKTEGIQIGQVKAIERTAINMLKEKLDDSLIKSVTGLSQNELNALKTKI